MSFGKAFLSSCLGAFVALVIFFVIGIVFLVTRIGAEEEIVVDANSVLHLRLDAQINELEADDPFAGFLGGDAPKIGLMQLKQTIANAKEDDNVKGIYVEVSYPLAGFSTIEEIRQALIDFRKSGKWVVAYNEVMTESAYYLSSAADHVYLNPEGEIEFNGLTAEIGFFKKLLDKLEIRPQVFRVGEFKSAVEPFLLEKMSEENRLQLQEMVNSIYDHVLTQVAESRNIAKADLKRIADNMEVRSAAKAMELKLVDSLFYKDQFDNNLRQRLGLKENEKINFIRYSRYKKSFSMFTSGKNEIAVIVAEGTIMPGENEQADQIIGGDSFVEEIRKARTDDDVKAIVIRVNSPGGEFRASDMIWREIQLAKKAKPVIASMSDYAASGGYYLAMGCDAIVAQPHTITGSIGIFGMLFDMSGFLENKLGITFDEVRTGNFGDTYTVTRPLTEPEKNYIQKSLEEHYDTFTKKAAEGRGITQEEILKVASGRVWTGAQAKERKLVDELGGFDQAVALAAKKANIEDDYKVRYYPRKKPFLEQLTAQLEGNIKSDRIDAELGELKIWYQQLQKVKTYQGMQARMPFELNIH